MSFASRNFEEKNRGLADLNQDDNSRTELYGALRLVGLLGFSVCALVIGFFLVGLLVSRYYNLGMAPIMVSVVLGTGCSFYWVYKKLTKGLEKSAGLSLEKQEDTNITERS